ncbi:MAG: ShlB/FhaC/HecB family hemolysin secretion/activation protein [Achromobacter sp.]|uniref:ShlB/FhaC/HecB family hemolysin secretion/activation protein n=1 Tax=Achromobacter sp. TaxID=134375 RepID=UPI0029B26D28|nr:ShlB/FhaC/HecB family hemolysin secretion/activation protein [Achromobacter sp.]MDX3986218.1 ShlB/FhaC/HecB family hemolysin secretion/activation protein [Achromobacter sp.]
MPAPDSDTESGKVTTVLVHAFQLEGNDVYDNATLQALLVDVIGTHQGLEGLRAAATRLSEHYHAHGYLLARAYLPPQQIDGGVVRIRVMEGLYGQVILNNASRTRDGALSPILDALPPGTAVQGADLDSALLRLNDLPGVVAIGTLRAGAVTGETDLIVNAQPGPWIAGSIDADNYGGAYTGEYRLSAAASINSPLGLGDQFDVRLLSSDRRQRYYHLDFQVPVGPWSTRIGAGASNMRYELGREFAALEAHGQAQNTNAYLRQTLLRGRDANVQATLQYEHKRLRDNYDYFNLSRAQRIGLWTAAVNASLNDTLGGGASNGLSLAVSRGNLRFGDDAQRREDRFVKHAGGGFGVFNLGMSRLQRISGPVQFFARMRSQWSSKNLDSSEKFSLGGPYGVRAYAPGAASGDQGWQATGELRYLPLPGLQFSAFVDTGSVQVNKRAWTAEPNRQSLSAFGVGVAHGGAQHLVNVSAAWPWRQGSGAAKTDRQPQFWVQATRYF